MRQKKRFRSIRYLLIKHRVKKKHLKGTTVHKIFGEYIFDHDLWLPSKSGITKGIALGLFFGLLPIYGFQIISCIAIALLIRANLSASVLFTCVTNPITIPFVLIWQYNFGKWITGTILWQKLPISAHVPNSLLSKSGPLLIGCSLSAIVIALTAYLLSITFWDFFAEHKKSDSKYEIRNEKVKIMELQGNSSGNNEITDKKNEFDKSQMTTEKQGEKE